MFLAIIGNKVKKSLSPIIYNNIFIKKNIIYIKISTNIKNLFMFIIFFMKKKFSLFNITIPYKEKIIKMINFFSYKSKMLKTINCIIKYNSCTYGFTTDGIGFYKSLKKNIIIKNNKALLLGTGGASKSIMPYIIKNFSEIKIFNRNIDNLKKFNKIFKKKYKNYDYKRSKKNLFFVINTIPYVCFVKNILKYLNKKCFIYLINYRIKKKLFDGSNMLFEQALENVKIFKNYEKRRKIKKKIFKLS
ncbi:hypothetical protein [Candidatus Vidania fulgoroideorum]